MPLAGGAKQMSNQDGRPSCIGAGFRVSGRVGSTLVRGQGGTGWEDAVGVSRYLCTVIGIFWGRLQIAFAGSPTTLDSN